MLDYKKNTDLDWEIIAQSNPYWGVLTNEKFKNENLTSAGKDEFFLSGEQQISDIAKLFTDFGNNILNTVLDFGSGVGRLLIPMSKYAKNAIGIEISESMRNEMKKNIEAFNVKNVKIFQDVDALINSGMTTGIDWINSYIVFQHISPFTGYVILEKLLRILNVNGYISLHFCIFNSFATSIKQGVFQQIDSMTLKVLDIGMDTGLGSMQMYDYDLNKIHYLLLKYGIANYQCFSENHGESSTVRILGKRGRISCLPDLNVTHKFLAHSEHWAENILHLEGFSQREEWGTWTDEPEAKVTFIPRKDFLEKQLTLTLRMCAHLDLTDQQSFKVFINENLIGEYTVDHENFADYKFQISPLIAEANQLKFVISNPTSPAEKRKSADTRKLGLGIADMFLMPTT